MPLRALIVLLVVTLLTSGFAHRFVAPADQSAFDYAQTFGLDFGDIFGDVEGTDAQQACYACLLHAAMCLPEPTVSRIAAELSLDPTE